MKKYWRKVTSGFMAMVMCLSVFMGIGTTTAFAAGESAKVYMVSFPRDGDANYSANWGHPELHYKNGWHSGVSRYTSIRAMNSYDGNICYCIEPGVSQRTGDSFASRGEDFWDNYPSSYNDVLSPREIKSFIGRIFQYGYTGQISTSWRSQNSGGDNLAHAYATQILIWETVIGERDSNFNHAGTNGCSAILDCVAGDHPLRGQILNYYNYIVSSVQNHTTVPSFMEKAPNRAMTVSLDWDGTQYKAVLVDSNNVVGNFSFSSADRNLRFEVQGDSLVITTDVAPSEPVSIKAENSRLQRRGVITWTDGVYGPNGNTQDTVTYAQEVTDPVQGFLKVKVDAGSAKIVKTSEDGVVEGITFNVSGNGINTTVKTGADGTIQIDNLMPGVYTVTEQSYDRYEPQETHRVTVVAGQVATVNFNNVLKRGDLQVIKNSEDNLVEGVTFHLYGTSLSGIAVDEYAVTDASGVASFNDILISGTTPYTIEEVDTAVRYVVPENQTAPVHWNDVTNRTFTNILKKFSVTVTKSDVEKGHPQGDATLAGAKYGIFKGEQLVDEYYTDENGQFTTKEYICGYDWTVKELEPSEGYLLDSTVHKVGAEPELYTVEHNLTANDVTEQVMKGNIAIIKHTDDGETQIETPEEGAEFQIYLKKAGSFDAADPDERDTIVCDENGFGQTKNMPYGTYTVHQTKGWDGRELMKDFDVLIARDGQTYHFIINNRNFESYIKVVKVDAETGKTIPYAGAGFQIYDPYGNLITMTFTYPEPTTIDTFYTNAEGTLVTPEKLEYGTGYSVVEVQAPYGYVLDQTPIYFDVTEDNSTDADGITIIKVEKPNIAQKGTISVGKTGEVFAGVTAVGGSDNQPAAYQPVYAVQGLAGAVYEIRTAEDIITPDGTVRAVKGELVDTVTTGTDGFIKSKELYLGKYEVQEIQAPDGMVLNGEIHTVELVYAGQDIAVTETATSFQNDRQKVQISLEKALEINELFGIGNNGEIKNVSFGLFASEELIAADGTSIPVDGLIEIITLDENGKAVIKTDLPMGSYYVQELATDNAYILSDEKYPVVFEYAGQDVVQVNIAVNNGEAIGNKLKYGSVSGMKVDQDGKALGGALIGLFKSDDIEFTKENALMTTTSADDGSFSFANIPYGSWFVREIKQPTGYTLNDTVWNVIISENEQIVEIRIENKLIHGNVSLTKVDAEYPDNKLAGAVFEIYADTNGSGELDSEDKLIGTLNESETGIYTMYDLLYGRYFVKETKAPDGFVQDTGIYEVFIDTDGKTYVVENKAGIGFINEAMRGNLKIVKTSSDGKVKGFAFKISGPNGFETVLETNENGEIHLDNLRIGEYTISEVANSVSAMYEMPADKKAAVQTGSTTVVEMHNVLRDTPQTGDNSMVGLWIALAGLSAVGAVTSGVFLYKKKKEENE